MTEPAYVAQTYLYGRAMQKRPRWWWRWQLQRFRHKIRRSKQG